MVVGFGTVGVGGSAAVVAVGGGVAFYHTVDGRDGSVAVGLVAF